MAKKRKRKGKRGTLHVRRVVIVTALRPTQSPSHRETDVRNFLRSIDGR